jgi:hypothetical protein
MRQHIGKLLGFTVTLLAVLCVVQTGHAAAHYQWTPQPGVNSPQIPDAQAQQLWPCVDSNGVIGGGRSNALAVWISANNNGGDTPDYVDNVQVASGTPSIAMTYNYAGVNCQNAPPHGSQEFRSVVVDATGPAGTSVGALDPAPPTRGTAGQGDLLFANGIFPCDTVRGCYLRDHNTFTFSKAGGFTTSGKYTITAGMKQVNHYSAESGGRYECINESNDRSTPLVISGFGSWNSCKRIPLSLAINVTVIPVNHPPTGAIGCVASSGACCSIHVDFNDQDGQTEAQLLKDGVFYKTLTSQPVNVSVANDVPYSTARFTLQVRDRKTDADGGTPTNGTWTTILGTDGQPISVTSGPCASAPTCGSAGTPGSAEQGEPFELDASFSFVGSGPPDLTYTISINGQSWNGPGVGGSSYSAGTGSGVITVPGVTINAPGTYSVTWSMTYPGHVPILCSGPLSVYSKPYFQVMGGDVGVGGGVPSVDPSTFRPTCSSTTNTSAIVASWNKRDASFNGAGAQYAVRALLGITDFAPGQTGPGAPVALAFANTDTGNTSAKPVTIDLTLGKYGGSFGDTGAPPCDTTIIDAALAKGSTGVVPGTGGDATIPAGNQTYVVKGHDVYITGNISYDNTGDWGNNVNNIPNFRLVVLGGNIYIAPGVTNLDGLYYAAPNIDGTKGQIVTCATLTGPVDDALLSGSPPIGCNNVLTVNGSFMAKRILLLRTFGTLHNAPGVPAEVFNYSPEQWISTGGGSGKNDAYTSLPPVL